ncbi:MAG: hypothetical protein V1827_04765 [Candidatus Micrarchaeota archaeon]
MRRSTSAAPQPPEGKPIPDPKNAKTGFRFCDPMCEKKPCAVRLASDRDSPSSLSVPEGHKSVYASVKKGRAREHGQDAAIWFSSRKMDLVGVLDGFGNQGTFLSEAVADGIIEALAFSAVNDILSADVRGFLISSVFYTLESFTPPPDPEGKGGTTAAIAMVAPDGSFSAAGIGDSAIYHLFRRGVGRLFSSHRFDALQNPITGTPVIQYFYDRNVLQSAINFDGISTRSIDVATGVLAPGECLLLVSDGITKSLSVSYDPESACVRDSSGCRDLKSILKGERDPKRVVEKLQGEVESRIEEASKAGSIRLMGKNEALLAVDDDISLIAYGLAR